MRTDFPCLLTPRITASIAGRQLVPVPLDQFTQLGADADSRSRGQKIDLGISLSIGDPRFDTRLETLLSHLMAECTQLGLHHSINQTQQHRTDAFVLNVEVKRAFGTVNPVGQLASWSAAGHVKHLLHGWDMTIPTIGITVVGHVWEFWIMFWREHPLHSRGQLVMLGPEAMGDTKTWLGILRILHVLKAMLVWGHEKFRKMFKEGVMDRLEPKRTVIRTNPDVCPRAQGSGPRNAGEPGDGTNVDMIEVARPQDDD